MKKWTLGIVLVSLLLGSCDLLGTKKESSSNADLASLSLSTGTLSPAFSASVTSYTATVPNTTTSVTVLAETADENARVSGTRSKTLAVGSNLIELVVTAQDGTVKTYTITVTRLSSNANLDSLSLSTGTLSPAFLASVTSYSASVPNATTSLTVSATEADGTASVSGTGAKTLAVGSNPIEVVVTAQDGTVKTYTIHVTRLSSNADLASLSLSAGSLSPVFSASVTSYSATVPNATTSLTVSATTADGTATVFGTGPKTLALGENTFNISVTAQDGSQKTYYLTLTRLAMLEISWTVNAPQDIPVVLSGQVERLVKPGTLTITTTFSEAQAYLWDVDGTEVSTDASYIFDSAGYAADTNHLLTLYVQKNGLWYSGSVSIVVTN